MSVVESFERRWARVVEATLEMLADGTDTVTYSIAGTRPDLICSALPDEDDPEYDPEEEHYHEVPALTLVVVVDRTDGFHWAGTAHVPLEQDTPTNAGIQTVLAAQWEMMVADHQFWRLRDLDDELDEIAAEVEMDGGP